MANIFLLDIIKALGEEGRQDALLFLQSTYFNREPNAQEIAALYQALLKAAPSFSETDLNREQVYHAVYPGKAIVPGKLDKLMSKLKRLLQTYILTKEYHAEDNEIQREIDWASWLKKKDLGARFNLAISKLKNQKEPETYFEHHRLMQIAEIEHEWENEHNRFKDDLKLPKLVYHLDLYYLTYRLELYNRLLLQKRVAQIQTIEIISNPYEYYVESNLILGIARRVNLLLEKDKPSIEEFYTLKDQIQQNIDLIPRLVVAQFKAYLRNCCTLIIDKGHSEYAPVLFELYKSDLENNFLSLTDKITANIYANIVQIAIRANQVAWAKTFTEEYKNRVHGESEDAFFYRLNMANCLFAERKFEAALDMIPTETLPSYYHLLTRRLELKAYYELDSDLLMYKMDSFRKYIERTAPKSITANLRTMNLNFVYILNQLSQSLPKDKNRSAKILQRIEEKKIIGERNWLIEKAKELG